MPGLVETREAYGETTLVVDPARLVEACTHLRDEHGFNVLVDVTATDYLGWPGSVRDVAGYIGTATGRDINAPGSQGLERLPETKPKRFSMSYHLLALPHPVPPAADEPEEDAHGSSEDAEPAAAAETDSAVAERPPAGRPPLGVRVRVQAWLDDGEPVETVVPVWPTADWHEREAWDMMGIPVEGHPNLVRLLMDEDWEGHPLRKDYPIGGEPVRFSGEE